MSYLDGIDESERVAAEFWAESRRKREQREEVEAATGLEKFNLMLRHVWTSDNLEAAMRGEVIRWGPQDLDEWLAEENPYRIKPVMEALGVG